MLRYCSHSAALPTEVEYNLNKLVSSRGCFAQAENHAASEAVIRITSLDVSIAERNSNGSANFIQALRSCHSGLSDKILHVQLTGH